MVRWVLPVVSVAAATILTVWLRETFQPIPNAVVKVWLQENFHPIPNALFFCAIVFSSWFGGFRAGILAGLFAILAIKYYCALPLHTLAISADEVPRLLVCLAAVVFISWVSDRQKRVNEVLRKARDELEEKVQARTLEVQEKTLQLEATNRTCSVTSPSTNW